MQRLKASSKKVSKWAEEKVSTLKTSRNRSTSRTSLQPSPLVDEHPYNAGRLANNEAEEAALLGSGTPSQTTAKVERPDIPVITVNDQRTVDNAPPYDPAWSSPSHSRKTSRSTSSAIPSSPTPSVLQHAWALAKSTLQTALPLGLAAAESFPIAKSVLGAVVEILKIAENVQSSRRKAVETIEELERIMATVEGGGERVQELWKEHGLCLMRILEGLVQMRDQDIISATLTSADDQGRVDEAVVKINTIVRTFHLQIALQTFDNVMDSDSKRELERLPYSTDAAYGKGRQSRKRTPCLDGTRKEILDELDRWLTNWSDFRVFWLNGMAGTGKSTIADSFTTRAPAKGVVVSSFFCSRDYESARDITHIIPTLAYQLAFDFPPYRPLLVNVLKKEAHPAVLTLEEQLIKLIIDPLKSLSQQTPFPMLLLADALDECDNLRIHSLPFIRFLLSHVDDFRSAHVKFFISSRPAHEISAGFRPDWSLTQHDHLILHEAPLLDVRRDILLYVDFKLKEIATNNPHPPFIFTADHVEVITRTAVPLFIFASTVCAFIAGTSTRSRRSPMEQLERVTTAFISTASSGDAIQATKALDVLYQRIFVEAFLAADGKDYDDAEQTRDALFVVATILLLSQPLGLSALADLLGASFTSDRIRSLLIDLHAVITDPDDNSEPVRILHASFQDHLLTSSRAHPKFYVDRAEHHAILAMRCLQVMMRSLVKDNICGLFPGRNYHETSDGKKELAERRAQCISPTLEYACQFWAEHLVKAQLTAASVGLLEGLQKFAAVYLLRWVEVLVIIGSLDRAVPMVTELRTLLSKSKTLQPSDSSMQLLSDIERLVYGSYEVINDSPTHIYVSALPFLPRQSILYRTYAGRVSPKLNIVDVISGAPETWDATLRRINVPSDVDAVSFVISRDSRTLACHGRTNKHRPGSLILWDVVSGRRIDALEDELFRNQFDMTWDIAFRADGRIVGLSRRDLRIWCADLHLRRVEPVRLVVASRYMIDWSTLALSTDGSRLAGAVATTTQGERDIIIWCMRTITSDVPGGSNELAMTTEHYLHLSSSAENSEDDLCQASICGPLAWSPDGSSVAALCEVGHVHLYLIPRNATTSYSFSSSSYKDIATAACGDEPFRTIWSPTGEYFACIHSRNHSGVSMFSVDSTAYGDRRVPQLQKIYSLQFVEGVHAITFHPGDICLTIAHSTFKLDFWITEGDRATLLTTIELPDREDEIQHAAYTPDGTRLIVCTHRHITILDVDSLVWSGEQSKRPTAVTPSTSSIHDLCFSPSGRFLATTLRSGGQHMLWDTQTGHVVQRFRTDHVMRQVLFSKGEDKLVVVSDDETRVYFPLGASDSSNPALVIKATPHAITSFHFASAALSPDDTFIVVSEGPQRPKSGLPWSIFIYYVNTGQELHRLEGGTPRSGGPVSWSSEGLIAFASSDGIRVWNFAELPQKSSCSFHLESPHQWPKFTYLSFSPTSERLACTYYRQRRSGGIQFSAWSFDLISRSTIYQVDVPHAATEMTGISPDASEIYTEQAIYAVDSESGTVSMLGATTETDSRPRYFLSNIEYPSVLDLQRRRVCRLSALARKSRFRVHGHTVAISDESGRILILHIKPLPPPSTGSIR
ncbi:hypothetical protein EIP91_008297 [Steccherinum ochraceum]|uniref:Nephrocystin 3-like N-terminal domain-containing protein n=1 Tax=Steccherinum ochraceum TaxID=92696 RepID=A0A4R0R5D2_9APHY|nr:hypothetical protein EIP91_008297 [Steccherinum ochraceum]